MRGAEVQRRDARAWLLACRQHGTIEREQLLDPGCTPKAIEHRLSDGRLHRLYKGVYAVGWPQPTREGRLMAAVLRCGDGAVLSHRSAGALWLICDDIEGEIHASIPYARNVRERGLVVH